VARGAFTVGGRRVVVLGAARSGIAAAELLVRRGASVTLSESRSAFEGMTGLERSGVRLEVGGHKEDTLSSADLIVASPGVPLDQPAIDAARRRGVEIIGELELASRWVAGPVIAVTGTKGKSTTTTLIGRMLSANGRRVLVGGNIGVPLSAQVEASSPDTVHVVETSSFQLETTSTFRPWIALWLNFAADHLDRHPDIGSYAGAKARIFANQQTTRSSWRAARRAPRSGCCSRPRGAPWKRSWWMATGSRDARRRRPNRSCLDRPWSCRAATCWTTCWPRPRCRGWPGSTRGR
jgi:UDP-N-acetylmuramoylalanine--D-glutamate ligase